MSERPTGSVRVVVPGEVSVITIASGESFNVAIEADGTRVVYLRPDDARLIINSGLPCALPWVQANAQLSANLGRLPKPVAGPTLGQLQMAQWAASRPLSVVEELQAMRAEALRGLRR